MHDASPPDGMPDALVDAHHHLWRLDAGAHYPWLQADYDPVRFMFGDYAVLCRDFGVDALRHAAQGAPIVASVHVEAERARDEALAETRWLHEVAESHGLPSAVVAWVDLLADDADERLAEQAAWPRVRGVRFKPRTSAAPDASVDGRARCAIGAGRLRSRASPAWVVLGSARTVLASRGSGFDARRCTGCRRRARTCRTAVGSLGRGLARWRRGMEALAASPRVTVKISELGLRDAVWNEADNARIIRDTIAIFGAQRACSPATFRWRAACRIPRCCARSLVR